MAPPPPTPPPLPPPPPPPPSLPPPPTTITTGTKSLVAERLLLAQSPVRVGPQYTDTAPLTLQGGRSKIQRINMSEAEDIRAVAENNDFQSIVEEESGRSSSVDYLDTYEDIPKETVKEFPEETKEELFEGDQEGETFAKNESRAIETERKEATYAAGSSTVTGDDGDKGVARRDESATRIGATASSATPGTIDGRNENAPVGEWNSLPLLVERLRAALEVSLGGRRDGEPPPPPPPTTTTTTTLPEDSGVDSEEDFRIRSSMEHALGSSKEPELKKDLEFLEDLLLTDIQTALSRLRETLDRIDVTVLAKHGAASDPTSKLQLLKLVSSLLSRLQVPEAALPVAAERIPVLPSTSLSRRRRGTRHTIGVSAEELAEARKWLEEGRNGLPLESVPLNGKEQKGQSVLGGNGVNVVVDKKEKEDIRDKCTKDAINQRQLLEDKNKEIRDSCAFRGIQQVDVVVDSKGGEEPSMYQAQYQSTNGYQDKGDNENGVEDSEERSRVNKLAAVLRQRAELSASGYGRYGASNKFIAKKTKIKRANTIDIPSYLKLQADSLGHETTGCVSLRKPISVGDKAFSSANVIVPTFQPKTENDRKFLALISKNNEAPVVAPVAPFKTFGQVKTMDMSSLTNENWNSRFSNIKTSFDKPSAIEERENKPSLKTRANKMFPSVPQTQAYSNTSPDYGAQVTKTDMSSGFRHAPSSPFRKIEKSSAGSPSKVPPSYHWSKNVPTPTHTLKEKARMIFDKENAESSSKSSRPDPEKPSFPRPPWIEHERNENRNNGGTVTANGKLDYRSFCKQFAPFVGKTPSIEHKKQEQRQRELAQRGKVSGVVDGKISFKVVPDKRVQTHQYPSVERRGSKEKFEALKSGKERGRSENTFADATLKGSSSVAVQTGINEEHQDEGRSFRVGPRISKGQNLICSNAAVQTTSELDKPTISVSDTETGKQWKPLYCEQPGFDQASGDRQRFVLDHNQNYHNVSSNSDFSNPVVASGARQGTNEHMFREPVQFQGIQSYQKQAGNPVRNYQAEDIDNQDYSSSFVSPTLSNYNQSDEISDVTEQKAADWPMEDSTLPNDENIQNQDISPEVGVVTRYTCAIATVASSVDSPEPRSEEIAADSRTSSSPSPSQWSWSRSRPPTNETITSEDEIRRHNLLQQSLVRRLQNEITSLNDQPPHYQTSNIGQQLTVEENQFKSLNQSPNLVQIHQQQSYNQPVNIVQSHQQQDYNKSASTVTSHQQKDYNKSTSTVSSHQQKDYNKFASTVSSDQQKDYNKSASTVSSQQQKDYNKSTSIVSSQQQKDYNKSTSTVSSHQQKDYSHPVSVVQNILHHQKNFNQSVNFDQSSGSQGPSRSAKYLTPVPQKKPEPSRAHSPGPAAVNRVIALREAYEQAPSSQPKPVHKERSPIPNGATPIDSSDEYLVSCATKPSRSIVLSKSESWHQLALSHSYPRAPRVNVPASTSLLPHSSHPKPPKPRSPSSQKLRSKQFEASSMSDSVKKMEDKIRQYFDHPAETVETKDSVKHRRSPRFGSKGMIGLARSRTMPGLSDEKLSLSIPAPQQMTLLAVNTADVDKVFDDLFEEATRTDNQ